MCEFARRGRPSRVLTGLLFILSSPARADALPMWEIEGITNHVVILGSIHFLRPGQDSLAPAMITAYEQADIVLMEIDLDDLDPVAAQATMQQLGVDPQGRTLDVLLGKQDYQAALDRAHGLGFDLAALQGFEPWMAALAVTQMQLQRLGFDSESGVEQQLLTLAQRDRKEIRGLETLDDQLRAMDALPPATQRAFLMQTLEEAATMKDQISDIVSAWKAGDTRSMEEEFLKDMQDEPELYRRIVVDRNRNWAGQVRALLRDRQNYLVVVGTLHLVGSDSLISMLDKAGQGPRQMGLDEDQEIEVE